MNSKLIALFENSGYITNAGPNLERIGEATPDEMLEFCESFSEITSHKNIPPSTTSFSHSASLSLGADRSPCSNIECRLNKANDLLSFAGLYSDNVYINNFLHEHLIHPDVDTAYRNTQIRNDLLILSYIYPFLKSGNIVPVTFDQICPHCLSVITDNNPNISEKLKAVITKLEKQYIDEVNFTLENNGDHFGLLAQGPEELLPHGEMVLIYNENTDKFEKINELINIKPTSSTSMTKQQVESLGFAKDFIERFLRSVAFELGGSNHLDTAYLSDNELEIQLIKDLNDDYEIRKKDLLMEKYLTCIVPFLSNISPHNLLKLRNEEKEHFILFRQSLQKAINEYKSGDESFNERDAKAIYSDIVEPRLAQLDIKVKRAKRLFMKDSKRKIVGWGASLTAGISTGILTSDLLSGSFAFTASKAMAEFLRAGMSETDGDELARQDDMYFLWRTRQLINEENF